MIKASLDSPPKREGRSKRGQPEVHTVRRVHVLSPMCKTGPMCPRTEMPKERALLRLARVGLRLVSVRLVSRHLDLWAYRWEPTEMGCHGLCLLAQCLAGNLTHTRTHTRALADAHIEAITPIGGN